MKTKKLFWLMLLAMVMSLGVVSCGDDDENENGAGSDETELVSKLQGKWDFYNCNETVMGMTITMDKSVLNEFKSSMGSNVRIWDETLEFSGFKVNGVSYSLNGNRLTIEGMEMFDGFTITIKSLTSSVLVLHEVFDMEGVEIVADMEYRKR